MDTPTINQRSFRGRNDDGTNETDATWKALANTNWIQAVDENFRIRFLVDETAGNANTNFKPQLQYNLNAADWNNVTASSLVVQSSASTKLTDGEDTTQQIGTGTFIINNDGVDEVNGSAGSANTDYVGNDETEFEYCVQILSADVADADIIELRVVTVDNYINTPSITVSEVSADVDVAVPLGAFTLAGQVPEIVTGVNLTAPLGLFTLSGQAPTIGTGVNIGVPTGSFALAGQAPNIGTGVKVDVPLGTFTISGFAPDVNLQGADINVPLGALSLAGQAPAIGTGVIVGPPAGVFTLAGQAPKVNEVDVQVPLGVFTLAGQVPGVGTGAKVDAPFGVFTLAGQAITVASGAGIDVPTWAYSLTGIIPAIIAGSVDDGHDHRRRIYQRGH